MNIKIKRLTDTATIPTKAHPTDACFDIYVDCPDQTYTKFEPSEDGNGPKVIRNAGVSIPPHTAVVLHTGFATQIPEGYFCAVFARSGLGIKQNLRPSNCVGIIDANYRGEWMISLFNDSNQIRFIDHGARVSQFAVLPVPDCTLEEVTELDNTDRGTGGFGSSGN